jgi:hypothetical protein
VSDIPFLIFVGNLFSPKFVVFCFLFVSSLFSSLPFSIFFSFLFFHTLLFSLLFQVTAILFSRATTHTKSYIINRRIPTLFSYSNNRIVDQIPSSFSPEYITKEIKKHFNRCFFNFEILRISFLFSFRSLAHINFMRFFG